ncbi:Na+/H+ antiporter NhaC family protein [Muricauda sp. 334s03]|uniref:Na+/H+ antiporter NhaC family protein n=1 Tax=Flagellimonas yonaguniensis TaxID=3031325 RepID=A0ABT5XX35_9FLAO|nr:Na+/H+ antiporter NhaC family protein [[Muricauda] yonaguniensis]MDF0715741.1 Na+/H+ antiporter NhaC family protein [[Muricauda] yonaguniensis]
MKKFPNAFVILLGVILLAWILTYIVPQGSYERVVGAETGVTRVVNDSYQQINTESPSIFDLLISIPKGIAGRAELIVLILLIGGCFYLIEKTDTFNQGLVKLVASLKGKESLALIIVAAIFTAGGASIGLQEEVVAMTPVLILFGKSLGYNTFTMLFASYGSTVVGSSFSPSNPFAVIIAQKEAALPLLSGSTLRIATLLIAFVVWVGYLLFYSKKNRIEKIHMPTQSATMNSRSKLILALLAITFTIVIYGIVQFEWGFMEMSGCFFALGIVAGLISKMGWNKTGETYVAGMKEMIFACVIIGLANSISIILKDGLIMDTIVYGLFGPLQNFPPALSGVMMMVSHTLLHFPVPSYSGQAILTLPILVPLSDLIGLSRQTCVLAYQYGAVMADMIVPTNGALMAILAIGNIPYNKWFKFALKPTLLMLLIGAFTIIFAVATGYN